MADTKLFDVPNLDGLSVDPDDYAKAEEVFRHLMNYSKYKKQSMEFRSSGDVSNALICEYLADAIYLTELPEWARW